MPRHQKSFGKVVLSFIQLFVIYQIFLGCFNLNILVDACRYILRLQKGSENGACVFFTKYWFKHDYLFNLSKQMSNISKSIIQ